jgi:phage recombination protein Bet
MATDLALNTEDLDKPKIELLKRTVCRGATPDEFELFLLICKRTRLDPFANQIYAVKRKVYDENTKKYEDKMTFQTGIDGARLTAQRTHEYQGQVGPEWCGKDGVWKDVWLDDKNPPFAARVGVMRKGFSAPTWGVCRWKGYAQHFKKDGDWVLSSFWQRNPDGQLAKCAEMQALRKSFPQELGDLFIEEEMEPQPYELKNFTAEDGSTEQKLAFISEGQKELESKERAQKASKAYHDLKEGARKNGQDLQTFFPTQLQNWKTVYEAKDWEQADKCFKILSDAVNAVKPAPAKAINPEPATPGKRPSTPDTFKKAGQNELI